VPASFTASGLSVGLQPGGALLRRAQARTHLSVNKDAPSPRTIMSLVALCRRHFSADFITNMSEFDFRQPQWPEMTTAISTMHEDHVDEHVIAVNATNPVNCTLKSTAHTHTIQTADMKRCRMVRGAAW
jgi:hypothetical protein